MKCMRCGKHFHEAMYSGICPKCGHFHNRQTEYDVSGYFSAKFEDREKTSTDAQAVKQHAQLHKMYDKYNMHGSQMQQGMSHQTGTADPYQQKRQQEGYPYQQIGTRGDNPYQQKGQQGGYPHQQTGTRGDNPYQRKGQQGNYPYQQAGTQGSRPRQQYGNAKPDSGALEKNMVALVCFVLAAVTVVATIIACNIKRVSLTKSYTTLDYEQEFAGPGELFEINGRMLVVEKAEVVDTSMLDDIPAHIPAGDKLVAVTVGVLPTEEWDRSFTSGMVYLSDGYTCSQYLDSYTLGDVLIKKSSGGESSYYVTDDIIEELYSMEGYDAEEILTGYNYLDYSSVEGKTGKFYFLTGKDAGVVTISFDQEKEKEGISILEKRVSVALVLEEETP